MDSDQRVYPEDEIQPLVEIVKKRILEGNFPLTPRTDSPFIAKFIRARKYNVNAAYLAIQKYYNSIHANLEHIQGMEATEFMKPLTATAVRLLKHHMNGAAMVHLAVEKWDPKVISVRDLEFAGQFVLEECFQDPIFQVHGVVGILDLKGLGFHHTRHITYQEVQRAINIIFEMFPLRVAGVHLVNFPKIFWPIYKFVFYLLPKKLQGRIYIHGNLESLTTALSPHILPESLGGSLSEDEGWNTEILKHILERNPCYDSYWDGSPARVVTSTPPDSDLSI